MVHKSMKIFFHVFPHVLYTKQVSLLGQKLNFPRAFKSISSEEKRNI